jgi:Acetyltransferase (GNAT) domain
LLETSIRRKPDQLFGPDRIGGHRRVSAPGEVPIAVPGAQNIRAADPLADSQWDSALEACPGASFFHGSGWARVLHDTYGFKPVYLAAGGPGKLSSLLPVMEVDSWLTGRRGVSLPFTDACEPLCPDADSGRRLFQEALLHAESRDWKYLECRGGRHLLDGAPSSTSFFGHRLQLEGDEATLFSRFDSSCQRAIRKAEKSGLTVEFSRDIEAVKIFYGLLCKTRRRHGLPPQPYRFFENIHRHVLAKGMGWTALARSGRVPVAGAMYFCFGETAHYKFGASDEKYQQFRGNNLVMWEAIKRFAAERLSVLDFGRTSLGNEGLRTFKQGWGAKESTMDYIKYDLASRRFVTAPDDAIGWHNRVFSMLPGTISRLVGRNLYKHVA